MSNQILKLRRSSVPGKIPTTASLDFGEIALNTYDGLAFMKKSGSAGEQIVTIGSTTGAFTGSFSGSFTGSLSGTASWAINAISASYVPASGVVGLNLSRISTGSVTASVDVNGDTFSVISGSSTFLYVSSSGRVGIGTTSVTDTLTVSGSTLLRGAGNTSGTTALTVQNSDGTNILNVRNDGAVQIGSQSTGGRPYLAGYTGFTEFGVSQTSLGIVTQNSSRPDPGILIRNTSNFTHTSNSGNYLVLLTNYSPTSGTGLMNNFVIQPTINQTGGANGVTRGLYVIPTLTAAADWRSIEWSNSTGWGLYGSGSVANYLAGNLSIATTNTPRRLNIQVALGSQAAALGIYDSNGLASIVGLENATRDFQLASVTGIRFYSNSTIGNIATEPTNERARITNNGNFLIGTTTDFGFRLDVSGSARINDLTGSLFGTSSWARNAITASFVPSSGVVGDFSRIATGSVTASVGIGTASFQLTSGSSTFLFVSSSGNVLVGTTTDSGDKFQVSGSGRFTNGLQVTSSLDVTGSITTYENINFSQSFGGSLIWRSNGSPTFRWGDTGVFLRARTTGRNALHLLDGVTGGTPRIVVDTTGTAIGLGNALGLGIIPSASLLITGSNTNNLLIVKSTDTPALFISGNGLVGINTSTASFNLDVSGSGRFTNGLQVTSSLNAPNITGSLFGTASWALNALTASSADNLIIRGNLTGSNALFTGTVTAQTLVVQTITSSVDFVTGSTRFGSLLTDTHQFTGSVSVTGSLSVNGGIVPLGSGTAGQVTVWSTANQLSGSNNLFWDTTNGRLGVGISSPTDTLTVTGSTLLRGSGNTSATSALTAQNSDGSYTFRIRDDGNLLYSSASQNIFNVRGDTATTIGSNGAGFGIINNAFNNYRTSFNILGFISPSTWTTDGIGYWFFVRSATSTSGNLTQVRLGGVSGQSFSPATGTATYTNLQINSTISQSAAATGITRGLYVNPTLTAAADWRSIEWSNNTGWGLYGAGTANNYLRGNLGINTLAPSASLHISGSTGILLKVDSNVQNNILYVTSSGQVGIGTATPAQALDVSGSARITTNLTASRAFLSSSNGTASGSTLIVFGSGSTQPVFTVQGSQGELFSVNDSLSGSLFSVNDVSGLPIIEAFSDNTVLIGSYQAPMLTTTVRTTLNSGSNVIYRNIPTASYDAVFFEYSLKSGSNARAGSIMGIWSGSDANYNEVVTTDFGDTTGVKFMVMVTGSNVALTGSAATANWTMKTIVRGI